MSYLDWREGLMAETNDPRYFKVVDLLIYNCPVFIDISDEEKEIYQIIGSICNHYGTINSRLLWEQFGLNENIGGSLLKIMAIDLDLLIEEENTNEPLYRLSSRAFSDFSQKKSLRITKPARKRFTICRKPLFLTEKYIHHTNDKEFLNQHQIYQPLVDIQEKIQLNHEKRVFNIPHAYMGINFDHSIEYLGKNSAKLFFKELDLFIQFKNYLVGRVNKNHPDYSTLFKEYSTVKNQSFAFENDVFEEIKKQFPQIKFSSSYELDLHIVQISLDSSKIEHFGQIYQIYQTYNNKIQEISIGQNWIKEIEIRVSISNSKPHYWIKFFEKLLYLMKQKASQILNLHQSSFIEYLKKIHEEIPCPDYKKFNLSIFLKYLEQLIMKSSNDWFFVIYSKIKEIEVIE